MARHILSTPTPTPKYSATGVTVAFAREFNAITRQTLFGQESSATTSNSSSNSGGGSSRSYGSAGMRSAAVDLRTLAASGRSVGWFLRLASTAVGLLGSGSAGVGGDRGLTRQALLRAGEMLAPDPHAQALRSLSVTQVCLFV